MARAQAYFISDLHLSDRDPATLALFRAFLQEQADQAERLYMLGDLFDAWIGDDAGLVQFAPIVDDLRRLSRRIPCHFLPGNRDFLVGQAFAEASGCELLDDPQRIELEGLPLLLMHGDLLCTDDLAYQTFRRQIRDPALIRDFLQKPLEERLAIAAEYRRRSGESNSTKPDDIMDVNQQSVVETMVGQRADILIHGHTHRPADHALRVGDRPASRHVLGQWQEGRGEVLSLSQKRFTRLLVGR